MPGVASMSEWFGRPHFQVLFNTLECFVSVSGLVVVVGSDHFLLFPREK